MRSERQKTLPSFVEAELELYEASLAIQLRRLQLWGNVPSQRTDWALEGLLDEIRVTALALRRIRSDQELPF